MELEVNLFLSFPQPQDNSNFQLLPFLSPSEKESHTSEPNQINQNN